MKLKSMIAAAIIALSTSGAASAMELRLATIVPAKSIWGIQVQRYADKVKELSGGDLTIQVFANAELGTMGDTMKMVLRGRLDMWLGATPVMASVTPEMAALTLPYLFKSSDEMKCVIPALADKMHDAVGGKYELLKVFYVGSQSIGLVGEGKLPGDLAGKKLRSAPLPSSLAFFKSIGATPQPLPAAETTAALSTGLVEGVDLAITYYVLTGANKQATNLVPTSHVRNLGGLLVSPKTWAKLSDEQKKFMMDAAQAVKFETLVDEVVAFEGKMIEKHKASGGSVTELSAEDLEAWQKAGQAVWKESLDEMGDSTKGFVEVIDAARGNCGG